MTFLILGINQTALSQNINIEITPKQNLDKRVDFYYTKGLPGSYYLKIEFSTLGNSYPTDFEDVIKKSTGRLFKLQPINKQQPVNFSYTVFIV